jgi:hypothetical protein
VKLSYRLLIFTVAMLWCWAASVAALPKEKEKEHEGKQIDSGTFGVFQNGHRVGTETFSIYQVSNGSVIDSEFKSENTPPDVQHSEMRLSANGEIRRYEWKELSPEVAESVLVPNDDFLLQKWSAGAQDKEHEQPYLLPPSTTILDDYFFVDREVLAWRFLGLACKQDKGPVECPLRHRTQFATINPHQRSSAPLSMEFLGREKVTLKNVPRDLIKLELKTDAGSWQLWLDDQFKVLRMSVVGDNTVVERD